MKRKKNIPNTSVIKDFKKFIELLEKVRGKHFEERLSDYQEVILNILRISLDESFIYEVELARKNYEIPTRWYKNKRYKIVPNRYFKRRFLIEEVSKKLTPSVGAKFRTEFEEWEDEDLERSRNFNNRVEELAKDYKLDNERYSEFLKHYIFFDSILPFIFTTIEYIPHREPNAKVRLELDPKVNPTRMGLYIRLFQNTNLESLKKFIDDNQKWLVVLQQNLDPYPVESSNKPNAFKYNLIVYLLRKSGLLYKDIILKVPDKKDDSNLRTIVSRFNRQVINSKDIRKD